MDEQERREFENDAAEHGIPLMLDRMGMDGLGNEVVSLYKRIIELEAEKTSLSGAAVRSARRFEKRLRKAEATIERLKWQMAAMWADPERDNAPSFDAYQERLDALWAERIAP